MPRLPTPGGDHGVWGYILNEYLEVEHQADGKHLDATSSQRGVMRLRRDLGNNASNPYVVGLQGRNVASFAPANGQVLTWHSGNNRWQPQILPEATAGVSGILRLTNDFGGNATSPMVTGIQGRSIANTAPTDNQVLAWNDALSQWEPQDVAGGGGGGMANVLIVTTFESPELQAKADLVLDGNSLDHTAELQTFLDTLDPDYTVWLYGYFIIENDLTINGSLRAVSYNAWLQGPFGGPAPTIEFTSPSANIEGIHIDGLHVDASDGQMQIRNVNIWGDTDLTVGAFGHVQHLHHWGSIGNVTFGNYTDVQDFHIWGDGNVNIESYARVTHMHNWGNGSVAVADEAELNNAFMWGGNDLTTDWGAVIRAIDYYSSIGSDGGTIIIGELVRATELRVNRNQTILVSGNDSYVEALMGALSTSGPVHNPSVMEITGTNVQAKLHGFGDNVVAGGRVVVNGASNVSITGHIGPVPNTFDTVHITNNSDRINMRGLNINTSLNPDTGIRIDPGCTNCLVDGVDFGDTTAYTTGDLVDNGTGTRIGTNFSY